MTNRIIDLGAFLACAVIGAGVLGWLMNIQNLFQYPIASNKCIVSIAGIFIPFIGSVTGWIW